jgi:hypothetical protein
MLAAALSPNGQRRRQPILRGANIRFGRIDESYSIIAGTVFACSQILREPCLELFGVVVVGLFCRLAAAFTGIWIFKVEMPVTAAFVEAIAVVRFGRSPGALFLTGTSHPLAQHSLALRYENGCRINWSSFPIIE